MRVERHGEGVAARRALVFPDELASRIEQIHRRRSRSTEHPAPAAFVVFGHVQVRRDAIAEPGERILAFSASTFERPRRQHENDVERYVGAPNA
jgi:hypothetical protein